MGSSIGFTPGKMQKFIKSIKTITTVDKKTTLKINDDFDLSWGWIYYRKQDDLSEIKFKGTKYFLDNYKDFEKENFFIKDYPWEYEREFRILIKNKTDKPYDKLVIEIPNELYKDLKVKFAPELKNYSHEELLSGLNKHYTLTPENLFFSSLNIKMNLCKRNYESFLDYIRDELNNNNSDVNCGDICDIISSFKHCNTEVNR